MAHFLDKDVGVVTIDGSFLNAPGAQVIPLNNIDPPAGSPTEISGWGTLASGGGSPTFLQWTTVNVVDRAECLAAYEEDIGEK